MVAVIAGSAFTFMAGLTGYQGALYGRRTGQLDLHPFDYYDAAWFYQHLDPAERVRAFACFGGIPAYLRHWDAKMTLADALLVSALAPGHPLFREGEDLLRTEFHQEALYASILRAVAEGEVRPSDIARAVGRHGVNEIADHLRRLQELRFLRREVPVTEQGRQRSQRVIYRLADPYLRFWFHFVSPYQSSLQLGGGAEIWNDEIKPRLDEFVARTTWEEVVIQCLWRRAASRSLPVRVLDIGRWWDNEDEIDIVGLYDRRAVIVGECKWTGTPLDERVLETLQRKAEKLLLADAPLWVLASRSGFTTHLRDHAAMAGDVLLIEPHDLYASVSDTSPGGAPE
jgi:AAA+ ATPase superfamily predicted ATPase